MHDIENVCVHFPMRPACRVVVVAREALQRGRPGGRRWLRRAFVGQSSAGLPAATCAVGFAMGMPVMLRDVEACDIQVSDQGPSMHSRLISALVINIRRVSRLLPDAPLD